MDPITREKERALRLFGEPSAEEPHPYAIEPEVRVAPRPAATTSSELPAVHWRMSIVTVGILAGGVLGLLLFADDPRLLLVGPRKMIAEVSGATGYIDCAHVRLVGAAPLKKGDKGYSKRLDVDGDGVACEPILSDDETSTSDAGSKTKGSKSKRRNNN